MKTQVRKSTAIWILTLIMAAAPAQSFGQICSETIVKKTAQMAKFENVFGTRDPIIGMIHLAGSTNAKVLERALEELATFEKLGVTAAIIENYHGSLNQVELVLIAAKDRFPGVVLGVNVLPNDYATAFYLARRYGAKFIQLDFVSGKYDNSKDPIELDYRDYREYRREYSDILVLGGVHPKYYEPVKGSNLRRDLTAAMNRADAIVVTGAGTGKETPFEKIQKFREIIGTGFPLVIGAGVTVENGREQLAIGNGAIVGSYFKDGDTKAPVIKERISEIVNVTPTKQREQSGGSRQNQ